MLTDIFLKICGLSLAAGVITLAVLLLRLCFKKAPRWLIAAAWGLVALRLLLPFTIHSPISLLQGADTVTTEQVTVPVVDPRGEVDIYIYPTPVVHSGFEALDERVNPILREQFAPEPEEGQTPTEAPLDRFLRIAAVIWLCGAAGMLLYAAGSHYLLARKLAESLPYEGDKRVRRSDRIASPFILGIFRPVIYLPADIDPETADSVIAHEHTHLRRGDHLLKPLGFLLLGVYWFNPLLWLAYAMFCRDIEFACDEKVVADLAEEERLRYAKALLACGIGSGSVLRRRYMTACPLAFGEVSIKERVKKVLNFKKPAFWIILVAAVALIVAGALLLTSPLREKEPEPLEPTSETSETSSGVTDGEYMIGKTGHYGTFALPEGVTALAPYAFDGCTITTLVLPDSLRTVHSTSFEGMNLREIVFGGTTYAINKNDLWSSNKNRMVSSFLAEHPEVELVYDSFPDPDWLPQLVGEVEKMSENQEMIAGTLVYTGKNTLNTVGYCYRCSYTLNSVRRGFGIAPGDPGLGENSSLMDCSHFYCRRTKHAEGVCSYVYRNGFTYYCIDLKACFGARYGYATVVTPKGTPYTDFIDELYDRLRIVFPEVMCLYELNFHYPDHDWTRRLYSGDSTRDYNPKTVPDGMIFAGWETEIGSDLLVITEWESLVSRGYLEPLIGDDPTHPAPIDLYPVFVPETITVIFENTDLPPQEMHFGDKLDVMPGEVDGYQTRIEQEDGRTLCIAIDSWYTVGFSSKPKPVIMTDAYICYFKWGDPLTLDHEFLWCIREDGTLHLGADWHSYIRLPADED